MSLFQKIKINEILEKLETRDLITLLEASGNKNVRSMNRKELMKMIFDKLAYQPEEKPDRGAKDIGYE